MRINGLIGGAAALVCGIGVWGCGSGTITSLSPVSPSSLMTAVASGSDARIGPLDYHDPPPAPPVPDPEPTPPGTMPPGLEPIPGAGPAPAPTPSLATTRITIVGTVGTTAFSPNPAEAMPGDMLVWINSDIRPHSIVLDDGTVIGELQPNQTSAPVPLMTPTATYRCTLHPSMVGTIGALGAGVPPAVPEPGLPAAGLEPAPPAGAEPAPPPSMPEVPSYGDYRRR